MLLPGAVELGNSSTDGEQSAPCLNRRGFLRFAALSLGGLAVSPLVPGFAASKERVLNIYCPNTTETVRMAYWNPSDGYVSEAIAEISQVMRDHHNGLVKQIDPRVFDQLYALQLTLSSRQPIHILCGYRSPQTNAMLRRTHRGVAKESLHMRGMAADIRMLDRSAGDMRRVAVSLSAGGVGYYPRANFIHVDTGPVRTWGSRRV